MTAEAIFDRYWNVLGNEELNEATTGAIVRFALRLAVQDAYTAGAALCDDLAAIVASQAQADGEVSMLQQQLAQLDADNADLTQRLANLAGVQAEAERLRAEIADLRTQVIPDYQAELANLVASRNELQDRLDALTKIRPAGKIVDLGTVALPLGTNGAADVPPALDPVAGWWLNLDENTNDYRVSLDAGRRTFRQLSKRTRLLLLQAFARHVGNGNLPTQAAFDAARPSWMPGGSGLVTTFGCAWTELLTLTPFEVEP